MPRYAFATLDADGRNYLAEHDFALSIDALRFARVAVPAGGRISVGRIAPDGGGIEWLGRWTIEPSGPAWEQQD